MEAEKRAQKIQSHNERVLRRLVSLEVPRNRHGEVHGKFDDLTGRSFGKLLVVRYGGKDSCHSSFYWTQCSCGSMEKLIRGADMKTGKIISCGCYTSELTGKLNKSHGLSNDPWYPIAKMQQQRMTDPNHFLYPRYGGRGLIFGEGMETIAERIAFYRENFGEPKEGYTIDRYPNRDGGYAKDNVRYVTVLENNLNKDCIHHHSGRSATYRSWMSAVQAGCCKSWLVKYGGSFQNFLQDMGVKPEGSKLDRHDRSKPHGPDNSYWKLVEESGQFRHAMEAYSLCCKDE